MISAGLEFVCAKIFIFKVSKAIRYSKVKTNIPIPLKCGGKV